MDQAMRKYGMNVFELALSFWLGLSSWLCLLLAIAGLILREDVFSDAFGGGVVIGGLVLCFAVLGLWSAGIRQNGALKDAGVVCIGLTGLLLTILGLAYGDAAAIVSGFVLLLLLALICVLQYHAVRIRFKPRFFSPRQFQTMIKIADTMIDSDGKQALNSIEIAFSTDHMFAKISSPAAIKEVRLVMLLVEWVLPLLAFRPFPFSDLGTAERRALVNKVIGSKGVLKNVAKVMKLFACAGYYGDPRGMAQVGYIPFDDRPRAQGESQEPNVYKDPFQKEGELYGKV
jgi:hypothetical protein